MHNIYFFRNLKDTILFSLKYIFLLFILNIFCDIVLLKKLLLILDGKFYFFVNNFVNSSITYYSIILLIFTTIKIIIYANINEYKMNGDSFGISDCIGEIFGKFYQTFVSMLMFIFIIVVSSIAIIPGIILFNGWLYFLIYCTAKNPKVRNKNDTDVKYIGFDAFSKSWEITIGKRTKLILSNILLILFLYFCYLLIKINDFIILERYEASELAAMFIVDFFIIFAIKSGYKLDKVSEEEMDSVLYSEKERKLIIDRKQSDYKFDRFGEYAKNNAEGNYVKKKIK